MAWRICAIGIDAGWSFVDVSAYVSFFDDSYLPFVLCCLVSTPFRRISSLSFESPPLLYDHIPPTLPQPVAFLVSLRFASLTIFLLASFTLLKRFSRYIH